MKFFPSHLLHTVKFSLYSPKSENNILWATEYGMSHSLEAKPPPGNYFMYASFVQDTYSAISLYKNGSLSECIRGKPISIQWNYICIYFCNSWWHKEEKIENPTMHHGISKATISWWVALSSQILACWCSCLLCQCMSNMCEWTVERCPVTGQCRECTAMRTRNVMSWLSVFGITWINSGHLEELPTLSSNGEYQFRARHL